MVGKSDSKENPKSDLDLDLGFVNDKKGTKWEKTKYKSCKIHMEQNTNIKKYKCDKVQSN